MKEMDANKEIFDKTKFLVLKPSGLLWVLNENGLTGGEVLSKDQMWFHERISELVL